MAEFESEFVYHCLFFILSFGIVYPPTEFVSLGLTINHIFSSLLGSEEIEFVQYHLRRTCLTVLVHAFLPFIYVLIYYLKFDNDLFVHSITESPLAFVVWNPLALGALLAPPFAVALVFYWHQNNWNKHPIVENLRKYSNADRQWERVAADVNAELRRLVDDCFHGIRHEHGLIWLITNICLFCRNDKITLQPSPIHFVAATQNWIVKTVHYNVYFAYQSDTALIAVQVRPILH